jgi:hypothetical protein
MKSDNPASRIEWVFLGLSLCFGLGALVVAMFVPFDSRPSSDIVPLIAVACGVMAALFLGLHVVLRFRRKMSRREQLKKKMSDLLA